jgi:hypothetical protein
MNIKWRPLGQIKSKEIIRNIQSYVTIKEFFNKIYLNVDTSYLYDPDFISVIVSDNLNQDAIWVHPGLSAAVIYGRKWAKQSDIILKGGPKGNIWDIK